MLLTYYNNKSDKRYVDKIINQLTLEHHPNPVPIVLLEDTSIARPTFKMRDKDLYMTSNYVYVDDLHRFYFVRNRTVSNGYAYIECESDVLSNFKTKLRERSCVIKRQESEYNMYQVDEKTRILNYETLLVTNFPKGFDENNQEFVLCVVGNTSNNS